MRFDGMYPHQIEIIDHFLALYLLVAKSSGVDESYGEPLLL